MSGDTMIGLSRAGKPALSRMRGLRASVWVGVLVSTLSTPAFAQSSCETDMKRIKDKHEAVVASLNTMKKGGKLDPAAACPKLRTLAGIESEWVAYLTKNKDWCSVPDEALTNMEGMKAKTSGFASQACTVAEKIKKMKEQQAAGGAAAQGQPQVRLPAGPL